MRLHRCRLCPEERIKMLKIDIQRTYLQNHLFAHVEEEKKKTKTPRKEMTSVEIQANEDEVSLTKLRYMVQQLQEGGENVVIEEKIE